MFGYTEDGITGLLEYCLRAHAEMKTLKYDICRVSQIQRKAKWTVSLVAVIAKLLNAEASKNEDRVYTGRQTSPHIGYTITDKNGVTQIDAQFIPCSQQHTWARLAAEAILVFPMGTIIDLLNRPTKFSNFSEHTAMYFFDGLY
jgi:predicted lipase